MRPKPTFTSTPASPAGKPVPAAIIPKPVAVQSESGVFTLSANTLILVDGGSEPVRAVGQYLADRLKPASGYSIPVEDYAEATSGSIHLSLAGANAAFGPEGYALTVTPDSVTILANEPAGLFYGVQTLRQLFPPAIEASTVQPGPWSIGAVRIQDYPRYAWRGAMLDVARHFFSVEDVQRYIDELAFYKINRLHLHLSDDQGWRIQIKSWPNLTEHGAQTEVGGTPGGYYTQEQYSEIVAYAQSRFITIVPEIDMPGHVNAALSSYAELNCNGIATQLFTGIDVGFSSLCISHENTYQFVDDVLTELAALTPGPYLHVGGDETAATDAAEYVQFVQRVQAIVTAKGKQMVGWEEIAKAPVGPDAIAQHWNPGEGLVPQAYQQRMKIIMSPANKAYIDMKYDHSCPLGLEWAGDLTVEDAYSWDPANMVSGVNDSSILGVEAPLWSETLNTIQDIEYMAFPRLAGIAEIGWTAQSQRAWSDYRLRLAAQGERLEAMGVNFYRSPEIQWP